MHTGSHPLIPPTCQMENKEVVFKHWRQYDSLNLPRYVVTLPDLIPDFYPKSQSYSLFWEPEWVSPVFLIAPYFGIPFPVLTHSSSSVLYFFVKKYWRDLWFQIMKDASLHTQYHTSQSKNWYFLKDSSLLSNQHKRLVQCRVSANKMSGFFHFNKMKSFEH